MTVITSALLLVQVIILFFLERRWASLVVVAVSPIMFAGLLSFMPDRKNHEVTVAAAAYGAVLIVFIGKNQVSGFPTELRSIYSSGHEETEARIVEKRTKSHSPIALTRICIVVSRSKGKLTCGSRGDGGFNRFAKRRRGAIPTLVSFLIDRTLNSFMSC
jgi:hypothetical protein